MRALESAAGDQAGDFTHTTYARAMLNILEDFGEEKQRLVETQRAVLNILDDGALEKNRLEDVQRALVNILDDAALEAARLGDTERAMLNLLEDFDLEKRKVEEARALADATSHELSKQSEELARSNQDLQQFAYVASHDLQEPLRIVASFTQLLGQRYKGRLDADADEFIAFAVDGASRMRLMITDLLEYARLGGKGRSVKPVDCGRVLDQVLANLKAALMESHAQVTSDPLPTVTANETELTQLLQNLISNAIKFRSDKSPLIHVSAKRAGGEYVFAVHDNGIGIAQEHRDRIFVIFQRLNPRDRYSGTGIGLAICKKIVERQGGRLSVESRPEGGSTFSFTIPIVENATP
jgi:light-regulated signal transduction histidine kinase (bacteriophytochrome)